MTNHKVGTISEAQVIDKSVPSHDMVGLDSKDSRTRAFAATLIQIAGFWSVVLGVEVYSDTDYLEGVVARMLFFLCCAVLVVGGFRRWKIRSLHLAMRFIVVLLVFAAASVAAFAVIDQQLWMVGIMLIIAALAYRLVGNSYIILVSALALTGFAAFRAIDDVVIRGWGLGDAFISVLAIVLNLAALGFAIQAGQRWKSSP
ncbi:MAG: hypothetical protein ACXWID_17995 [Pyrinomonadaceae bacterium]